MDEQEIISKIEKHPHTYRTLLGEQYGNNGGRNSATFLLKKKILRNFNTGLLCRAYLNGSRGGEVLVYHKDKKHSIVITIERRDFKYYCCESINEEEKSMIKLINAEEYSDGKWVPLGDIEVFTGNIIKVV